MSTVRRTALGALLLVGYVLVALPLGVLTRLFRDPLRRRPDPSATTYWTTPDVPRERVPVGGGSAQSPA